MKSVTLLFLLAPLFSQNIIQHTNFPDPNFFNALDALFPGGLTESEAAMVDSLDVSTQNISDVTGLEYFKGLQYMNVRYNAISELPDLSTFPHLLGLFCDDNQLTELKGLESLSLLEGLTCSLNLLTDLAGLQGLTQFRNLNCSDNPITGLPDLSLTLLTHLNTRRCPITELPWLGDADTLEDIRITHMKLNELPDLSALHNLRYLDVCCNKLTQITLSDQAEDLSNLHIADNFFTVLPDISNYPYLRDFHFYDNLLTEFPVFNVHHTHVESLQAGSNLFDLDDCQAIEDAEAMTGVTVAYAFQGNYKTYVQEYPGWNIDETILYWVDVITWRPYRYELDCP